jgi:hypothetical protein
MKAQHSSISHDRHSAMFSDGSVAHLRRKASTQPGRSANVIATRRGSLCQHLRASSGFSAPFRGNKLVAKPAAPA